MSVMIERLYRITDCEMTAKVSLFVKRFPIEGENDDVPEKKENTGV